MNPFSQPWHDQALCAQTDPEIFYPEKGGSVRDAKKTCRSCPVATQCLVYALDNDERFGIWGGYSERERRKMTRGIPPKKPEHELTHGTRTAYKEGCRCEPCRLVESEYQRVRYLRDRAAAAAKATA